MTIEQDDIDKGKPRIRLQEEARRLDRINSVDDIPHKKIYIYNTKSKFNISYTSRVWRLLPPSKKIPIDKKYKDMNSRLSKLNGTVDEKYKTSDINLNLFNIYDYHNSFTASSYLRHSFHSTLDRLGKEQSTRYLDIPPQLIDLALSEFEINYYANYEDVYEPKDPDFSFENWDCSDNTNFNKANPPFKWDELSNIEHQPLILDAEAQQKLIADLQLLKWTSHI